MKSIFFVVIVFCIIQHSVAQFPWYEPNTQQELQLKLQIGNQLLNTENFYPRNLFRRIDNREIEDYTKLNEPNKLTFADNYARPWPTDSDHSMMYFKVDNPEIFPGLTSKKSVWKLYKVPSQLYYFTQIENEKQYSLAINPILNTSFSPKNMFGNTFTQNTRGIEIRGVLNNKIGFYSRVMENQTYFPKHFNAYTDSFGVVPQIAWYKNYKTSTARDYLNANGYITAALLNNTTDNHYVIGSFGHGNFKIGNGIRSLILDNNTPGYLFLKFNTKIGKFYYQNIFAQMSGFTPLLGNTLLPKKYMSLHRAAIKIGKENNAEIGITETVIHSRQNGVGGFDLDYLNPIIFYRSVEANLGSSDNALMAFDAHYSHNKKQQIYIQFLLDEFKLSNVKKGNWWGNKYALQLGLNSVHRINKLYSFMIQAEFNLCRPFTYSHYNPLNSFTHYNQALAHPLGNNFTEKILRFYFAQNRTFKYNFITTIMQASKGFDPYIKSTSYGGDLRKDNDLRNADWNIKMYNGIKGHIFQLRMDFNYMLRHNLYIDCFYQLRNQSKFQAQKANYFGLGLRYNVDGNRVVF